MTWIILPLHPESLDLRSNISLHTTLTTARESKPQRDPKSTRKCMLFHVLTRNYATFSDLLLTCFSDETIPPWQYCTWSWPGIHHWYAFFLDRIIEGFLQISPVAAGIPNHPNEPAASKLQKRTSEIPAQREKLIFLLRSLCSPPCLLSPTRLEQFKFCIADNPTQSCERWMQALVPRGKSHYTQIRCKGGVITLNSPPSHGKCSSVAFL